MKIPFDIKYRPQIESGEYKLVAGKELPWPARIVCWNFNGDNLIVVVTNPNGDEEGLIYTHNGKHKAYAPNVDSDLFIITPEPELSEFEEKVKQLIGHYPVATRENKGSLLYEVRKAAAELLSLAIDARATELSEGLEQSKIDKDSIPYHLIEFMCNLYDCQNWKEIEDTAELYTTRVKAAALKDLPRWRKDTTDRAAKWIREHWREYIWGPDADGCIGFGLWENDFRKAMEEE